MKERWGSSFLTPPLLVPGLRTSVQNMCDVSVFAKRLLRSTPALAYKILRFSWYPLWFEAIHIAVQRRGATITICATAYFREGKEP
jgi:hypothetical protein